MSVLTLNGEYGFGIGRKKREWNEVCIKGRIELWNNNELVVCERFIGRTLRKKIIEKWYLVYQLKRHYGYYFQIAYE